MTQGRSLLVGALLAPVLVLWAKAAELNVGLPVWGSPRWGVGLATLGALVAAAGVVTSAIRAVVPQPVYTGLGLACFGISMYARSRAGLWLVSPVLVMAMAAYAIATRDRVKERWPILPADDDSPPTLDERMRYWFTCALAWVALYEFTAHMRLPGVAYQFAFEDQLPIFPSTSLFYQTTYIAVTFAPWLARTRRELRRLTISAWVATALIFPFYWIAPSSAPRRPMEVDGALARLLAFERNANPPSAAFPSFHVLWSIFIAPLVRPAWLGWLYAVLIAVSCITTGMHYIPDVLVSFAIAPLFMEPGQRIWLPVRAVATRLGGWFTGFRVAVIILGLAWAAGMTGPFFDLMAFAGMLVVALPWPMALARLRNPFPVWTGSVLLGLVLLRMFWQSSTPPLLVGVFLIGEALIRFVEAGRYHYWTAGVLGLSGVWLTTR